MTKMRKVVGTILVVATLTAALGLGFAALMTATATPAEAARCICPKIYAPVVCDNGKTYPNACIADCRNGRNCVPVGAF
jgi:hypothetical protein